MTTVDFRQLRFGLEIEFTGVSRRRAAEIVGRYFATVPSLLDEEKSVWAIMDDNGRAWRVVRDSSVVAQRRTSDGEIVLASENLQVELVSPILHYHDMESLQGLVRALRRGSCFVNESCGIHVHVGAELFDATHLRVLCNMVYSKQLLLERSLIIFPNRKNYCRPLSEEFINALNRKKPRTLAGFADIWYGEPDSWRNDRGNYYHFSRYQVLNLHNLLSGRIRTAEFRGFNSTLHAGKVKSYIQLCLLICGTALSQTRASAKPTIPPNGNEKWSLRLFLLRIGAIGPEFKTLRQHLLSHLHGDSAWK